MPEKDYVDGIYGYLKSKFQNDFEMTPEQFKQKLSSDSSYANGLHGFLKTEFKDDFQLDNNQFQQRVGYKAPASGRFTTELPKKPEFVPVPIEEKGVGLGAKVPAAQPTTSYTKVSPPDRVGKMLNIQAMPSEKPAFVDNLRQKAEVTDKILNDPTFTLMSSEAGDMNEAKRVKIFEKKNEAVAADRGYDNIQQLYSDMDESLADFLDDRAKQEYIGGRDRVQLLKQLNKAKADGQPTEDLQKKYDDQVAQFSKAKAELIVNANEEVKNLRRNLEGADPDEKTDILSQIDALEASKKDFFKPKAEQAKAIVQEAGLTEGTTDQEKVRIYAHSLMRERSDLREALGITKGQDANVAYYSTMGADNPYWKRLQDVEDKLEAVAPVALINETPVTGTESAWGVFGKVFKENLVPQATDKGTQQEVSSNLIKGLELSGVDPKNIKEDVYKTLEKTARPYEDWSSKDLALMAAPTLAIMPKFIATTIITEGLGSFAAVSPYWRSIKILSERGSLGAAATEGSLLRVMQANKYGRGLLQASFKGLEYGTQSQVETMIYGADKGEMGFVNGLVGGFLGAGAEKATKLVGKGVAKVITSIFGNKAPEATGKLLEFAGKVYKYTKEENGKAIGEVGEELGEDLGGMWMDSENGKEFFDKIEEHYGTPSKALKFFLSTYVMGYGFGAASKLGSAAMSSAGKMYKGLSEKDRAIADNAISDMRQEQNHADVDAGIELVNESDLSDKEKAKAEEQITAQGEAVNGVIEGSLTTEELDNVVSSFEEMKQGEVGQEGEQLREEEVAPKTKELESLVNQIPVEDLRRPNGSIGTQGFTEENMIDVARFISREMGFDIPAFDSSLGTSEIKQLIEYLRGNKEAQQKIKEYVIKDPVVTSLLPDGTYAVEDGNHRANLLNLIGVDVIPTIELNGRDKQTAINEHNSKVEAVEQSLKESETTIKNKQNEKDNEVRNVQEGQGNEGNERGQQDGNEDGQNANVQETNGKETNGQKEVTSAVQEPGTGEVLQRQSQEAGVPGSERTGVEQSQQGQEVAKEGSQEEVVPPTEGATTTLPAASKYGQPREMVYKDGKWQQKIGREFTEVSTAVQKEAEAAFAATPAPQFQLERSGTKAPVKPDKPAKGASQKDKDKYAKQLEAYESQKALYEQDLEATRQANEEVKGVFDRAQIEEDRDNGEPVTIADTTEEDIPKQKIEVSPQDTRPEATAMSKMKIKMSDWIQGARVALGMSDTLRTGEREVVELDKNGKKITRTIRDEGGIGFPFKSLLDVINGTLEAGKKAMAWAAVGEGAGTAMINAAKKSTKISGKALKEHYYKTLNLTAEQKARIEKAIPDNKEFGLVTIYKMGEDGIKSNEAFAKEAFRLMDVNLTEEEKAEVFKLAEERLDKIEWGKLEDETTGVSPKEKYLEKLKAAKTFKQLEDILNGDKSDMSLGVKAEIMQKIFLATNTTTSTEKVNPLANLLKAKGISIESISQTLAEPVMNDIDAGQPMILIAVATDSKVIKDKERHANYSYGVEGFPIGLFDETSQMHHLSPEMMDTFVKTATVSVDEEVSVKGSKSKARISISHDRNGNYIAELGKGAKKLLFTDKKGVFLKSDGKFYNEKGKSLKNVTANPLSSPSKEGMAEALKKQGYTVSEASKGDYTQKISGSNVANLMQKAKAGIISFFQDPQITAQQKLVKYLNKAFPNVEVVLDAKEYENIEQDFRNKKLLNANQETFGVVDGNTGKIYLNPILLNNNTPIHEMGHVWNAYVKKYKPEIYNKGLEIMSGIRGVKYFDFVLNNLKYQKLIKDMFGSDAIVKDKQTGKIKVNEAHPKFQEIKEYVADESLAKAIGDKGELFVNEAQRRNFKQWLNTLYNAVKQIVGFSSMSTSKFQDLTLNEFVDAAVKEILGGKQVSAMTSNELAEMSQTKPKFQLDIKQRVDKASEKLKEIFQRDNIPLTIAEAKVIVEEVSDWTSWYDDISTYVNEIFGEYSEDVMSMLPFASMAANSSATVGLAINNAERIYRGEVPVGMAEYYKYVSKFLEGKGIESDKMGSFLKALMGDKDAIAVDMHVWSIIMGKNPGKKQVNPKNEKEFERAKEFVRAIASELGLTPREVQAALWAANIMRTGGRPDSYEEYFKKQVDEKGLKERIENWRNEGYKPFSQIRKEAGTSAQEEVTVKSKSQKNEKTKGLQYSETEGVSFLSESGGGDYASEGKVQREEGASKAIFNSVVGVWNKFKNIQFSGTTKVKDASDVAHIMQLLENKSVEQSFAVHVDKSGKSHVQFLSIGGLTGTVIDPKAVLAGAKKFKAVSTYLVHNHPSGKLVPSQADLNITEGIRKGFAPLGIKLEHIIMDTFSKEYVHIDEQGLYSVKKRDLSKADNIKLTTYVLDEQQIINEPISKVANPNDAANFIQQLRFTAMPKNAVMLLSNDNKIIGNYVFQGEIIDYDQLTSFIAGSGVGNSVIFYGNQNNVDQVKGIKGLLKSLDVNVLDYIVVDSDSSSVQQYYNSIDLNSRLGETQFEYGTDSVAKSQTEEVKSEELPVEGFKASEEGKKAAEIAIKMETAMAKAPSLKAKQTAKLSEEIETLKSENPEKAEVIDTIVNNIDAIRAQLLDAGIIESINCKWG
jgi:thermostable 8-oxoguanine DNA glycosylase